MDVLRNLKNKIVKHWPSSSFFTLTGFIIILCLSWFYLSPPPWSNEEERVHSFLQNQFQTLVSDFVAEKHPEVDNITFHKVWTKNTSDPHQVKIFFNYSLWTKGESGGELLIEGEALLTKSDEEAELWIVQEFQVTDSIVDFSEPLLIKAQPVEM